MRSGIAIFGNLPLGSYTVLARHASLNPTEVRQDVVLQNNVMLGYSSTPSLSDSCSRLSYRRNVWMPETKRYAIDPDSLVVFQLLDEG